MKNDLRRTDLAVELREDIEDEEQLDGIRVVTRINKDNDIKETKIIIENKKGAENLGKPIGNYITIESEEFREMDEEYHIPMAKALLKHLKHLIGDAKNILVIGLGNRGVTPDALGPLVVENLYITRHLVAEGIVQNVKEISAIAPGVMAQTGIETKDILKAIINETKPDIVIAVDALAARNSGRLNKTIQISDTGIEPGSGVRNNRQSITKESVGVKVIAIGVPTVISVPAIVNDSLEKMLEALGKNGALKAVNEFKEEERYQLACEIVDPFLKDMFVTPKNIDEAIKRISFTISEAINQLIM